MCKNPSARTGLESTYSARTGLKSTYSACMSELGLNLRIQLACQNWA